MRWKMKMLSIVKSSFMIALVLFSACQEAKQKEAIKQSRVETLPFYKESTFTPHWFETNNAALKSFHKISPFKLTNQDGKVVTEKTFKDKIYVTDFFFTTCPGICPKMTANLGIIQEEFLTDDEVLLLSHSVMPGTDSVSILKDYAMDKGVVSDKWHLVTGERADIYKLGRSDYFVEEDLGVDKDVDDFLHTENFVLIDKNRYIRGIYNGLNKTAINQLIADIKTLKKEG